MKHEEFSIPKSSELDLLKLQSKLFTWFSVHVRVSRIKHILESIKNSTETSIALCHKSGKSSTGSIDAQFSKENIYQAVWLNCDYTIKHLLATNC